MATAIGLPDGFELDQPSAPGLPDGFVVDQPGVAEDVAKSAGAGLRNAAVSTFGSIGDVKQISNAIGEKLADYAGGKLGMPQEKIDAYKQLVKQAQSYLPSPFGRTPTSAQIENAITPAIGPAYEPQTAAGGYARTAAELAPAAIGGMAGLGRRVLTNVVAPAAVSETAAQLPGVKGTAAEPFVRAGASIATAAGASKIAGALEASSTRALAPTQEQLADAADAAYNQARGLPFSMTPQSPATVAHNVKQTLDAQGFRDVIAPKTYGLMDRLQSDMKELADKGKPANISDVLSTRTALNKVGITDPVEKAAAAIAIDKIDTYIQNFARPRSAISGPGAQLASAVEEAQGSYAAAKRSERIGTAVEKAQLQASSGGIGANLDNALRQQFKSILNNPKLSRGYSQTELDAMRQVVRGNITSNVARALSRFGPHHLLTGTIGALGTYGATGDPWAALGALALGYGGQKYATRSRMNAINNLDAIVRARSPASTISPQQMAVALANRAPWLRQTLFSLPMLGLQSQLPVPVAVNQPR